MRDIGIGRIWIRANGTERVMNAAIEIKGRVIWLSVALILLAAPLGAWTSRGGDGETAAWFFAHVLCAAILGAGFVSWRGGSICEGVDIREDSETVIEGCAAWSLAMTGGAMMIAIGMPALGVIGILAAIGSGLGYSVLFAWILRGRIRPFYIYVVLSLLPVAGMCGGFALSWIGSG